MGGADLGRENILLVGDAASLVDAYRGLGLDNAAISARLAVKAILQAGSGRGPSAGDRYQPSMNGLVTKLEANDRR